MLLLSKAHVREFARKFHMTLEESPDGTLTLVNKTSQSLAVWRDSSSQKKAKTPYPPFTHRFSWKDFLVAFGDKFVNISGDMEFADAVFDSWKKPYLPYLSDETIVLPPDMLQELMDMAPDEAHKALCKAHDVRVSALLALK